MPRHSRFLACQGWTRALVTTLVVSACVVMPACLRRPVSNVEPTTKISFETVVPQPAIEKIDLLVMVDNSGSMADKQRILADAVPDLVKGLVLPKCVDKKTRAPTGVLSDPTKPDSGMCPAGSEPLFTPITDMHIGVISSSLGGMGSSSCPTKETGSDGRIIETPRKDDRGHLLAYGPKGDVAAAGDLHFLAWYPDVEKNRDKVRHPDPPVPKTTSVDELGAVFRDLIVGVGQDGCGFEAQLESVYRFLVQPDPWTAIEKVDGVASYGPSSHVDLELLRQRAAFLRPDSLVAIIVLTDEDDSSADPLSFQGAGWRFMDNKFLGSDVASRTNGTTAPRGTTTCESDPSSDACTSCAFQRCDSPEPWCQRIKQDPNCTKSGEEGKSGAGYDGYFSASEDHLNVRFHRMKQRFGVDPQFPISRYVDALTKPRVPRRDQEHDSNGNYAPKAACMNPLFAARLPTGPNEDLCDLPRGPRSPSLVYFAVIGGVPGSLLPDENGPDQKLDWTKILGRDPSRWDETDIDPHMRQSPWRRPGLAPVTASDDADPVHGREWTTEGTDLQFSCTFPLFERDDTGNAVPVRRPCSEDDRRIGFCDCDGTKDTPLCDTDDRTVQIKGKAYPTRRPLMVAKELDVQGIVASLCPKQLTTPEADDYGYRPAVRAITSKLERSLVGACLPRALERQDMEGNVACLVLAMLPDAGPDSDCERFGLSTPSAPILEQMRDKLRADEGEEATRHPICEIPQVTVPPGEICRDVSDDIAFCYAEAPLVTQCAHAIAFTKASQRLTLARFTMQCIQQSTESQSR